MPTYTFGCVLCATRSLPRPLKYNDVQTQLPAVAAVVCVGGWGLRLLRHKHMMSIFPQVACEFEDSLTRPETNLYRESTNPRARWCGAQTCHRVVVEKIIYAARRPSTARPITPKP